MRNIPVFTACGGTATLILREVPHTRRAYVLIQTFLPDQLEDQLRECASFCRVVGAAEVYAARADGGALVAVPAYEMRLMTLPRERFPAPDLQLTLRPLSREDYCAHYTPLFQPLLSAASLSPRDIPETDRCYLAEFDGCSIGIGQLSGDELKALGLFPSHRRRGLGMPLLTALLSALPAPRCRLLVCSANEPALALYRRAGFTTEQVLSRWYAL